MILDKNAFINQIELMLLHVLIVFHLAVEQLLNGRLKFGESLLFLRGWEVDRLISSRGGNVEFGIKYIDA